MARSNKKTILSLVLIYAALCALRYLLALVSSNNPVTTPDEFLYYSMARSFAAGEGALFYGQQANYSFCLYPLLLSVAYRLPDGTDFYRAMQVISILVMNLSVFPIYALGEKITKDEWKSMAVTVMAMLLPDFILA